jgi:hypothetical protein
MKGFQSLVRCIAKVPGTGLLLSFCLSPLWAAEMSILASFKVDPSQPHLIKFKNETPQVGFCNTFPEQCKNLDIFSLRAPIRFNSTGPIRARHTDPRQGATFKVPGEWRTLTVTHELTGDRQSLSLRIAGVGSSYQTDNVIGLVGGGVTAGQAHALLWGSPWNYPPPLCLGTGWGAYGNNTYSFFWRTPGADACVKQAQFDIPWFRLSFLEFAYELVTPNPLGMSSGKYVGSLTYSVAPHGDFDFGDVMLPDDNVLTFNFTLDVQHTLKVDVPPGGHRVELLPQGGWQAWLQRNRRPERLFRDQTFNLSASSRFRMSLECQHTDGGDNCSIYEPSSGHAVPLNIAVTLPGGMTDGSGQPVNRRRLVRSGSGTELFLPGHYIDRKPGFLHFEVGSKDVEEMLTGVSKTYRGNVTVVWDSEV